MSNSIMYVYEGLEPMYQVLNFIAMSTKVADIKGLIKIVGSAMALYYAVISVLHGELRPFFSTVNRYMIAFILLPVLFAPGGTMVIKDKVTGQIKSVSNLPVVITAVIGQLENLSNIMTTSVEHLMTPSYLRTDDSFNPIFGARLIKEYNNVKSSNGTYIGNVEAFIDSCLMNDIAMKRFSAQEFKDASDPFRFLSERSTEFLKAPFTYMNGTVKPLPCKEVAAELNALSMQESDKVAAFLQNKLLKGDGSARADIQRVQLLGMFEKYTSLSKMGDSTIIDKIPTLMLWNGLKDRMEALADTRSSIHQFSNSLLSARMAETYVPILTTFLKCLSIALVLFLLPIFIITLDMSLLKSWFIFFLALEITQPICAIIHILTGIAWHAAMPPHTPLTMSNYLDNAHLSGNFVMIALSMQALAPMLAWALVSKGGLAQGLIHLAGQVNSAATGAVNLSASEIATGSTNLGNTNIGNSQKYNLSGFKQDFSKFQRNNAHVHQGVDGTLNSVFSDGSSMIQRGANVNKSSSELSINWSDQLSNSVQAQESAALNNAEQYAIDERQAVDIAARETGSIMESIMKNTNISENLSQHESRENSTRADASFGKGHNSLHQLQANAGASLSILSLLSGRLGLSESIVSKMKGADISASLSYMYQNSHNTEEKQLISNAMSEVNRYAKDKSFAESAGINEQSQINLENSLSRMQSAAEQKSRNVQLAENFSRQRMQIQQQSSSFNIDGTDDLIKLAAQRENMTYSDAVEYIKNNRNSPQVRRYIDEVSRQQLHQMTTSIPMVDKQNLQAEYKQQSKTLNNQFGNTTQGLEESQRSRVQELNEQINQEKQRVRSHYLGSQIQQGLNEKVKVTKPTNKNLKENVDA